MIQTRCSASALGIHVLQRALVIAEVGQGKACKFDDLYQQNVVRWHLTLNAGRDEINLMWPKGKKGTHYHFDVSPSYSEHVDSP